MSSSNSVPSSPAAARPPAPLLSGYPEVHEGSAQHKLLERIHEIEPSNADVIFREIEYRHQSPAELERLVSNSAALEKLVSESADKIRELDFVPEWPIEINGKKVVFMNKSREFEIPDECIDFLRAEIKAHDPEEYEHILDFILTQAPLYITDVLQATDTLEFAIDEYRQERWAEQYRPFSVVLRPQGGAKSWWWNRWFGIGKSDKRGRSDVEGNPPLYPGETATCQADLDEDLAAFSRCVLEPVTKKFSDDADRIVGMLLNLPALQREKLMEQRTLLEKKASQCYALLHDKL